MSVPHVEGHTPPAVADWRQFADPALLVKQKQERDLTISVGIPTLNEQHTIGPIVSTIRQEVMERYPLVDEVAILDSGSDDLTLQRAREAGAQVSLSAQCLPELGERRGKGENLWKSLHLLKGDILVWVDADIRDVHRGYICGLLGPLLQEDHVEYTTAYYRRPLLFQDRPMSYEGGRTTELLGRPVLSSFLPEAADFFQPFAGEHAGYRSTLERLPFFCGYGVDIGLLLDILRGEGSGAIAQVNLGERLHRNRPLAELSLQAFGVLQAILKRAQAWGRLTVSQQCYTLKKPEYPQGEAEPVWSEYRLVEEERPAMRSIPAYLRVRDQRGERSA